MRVKVRMKTAMAGPGICYRHNQIVELEAETAREWALAMVCEIIGEIGEPSAADEPAAEQKPMIDPIVKRRRGRPAGGNIGL